MEVLSKDSIEALVLPYLSSGKRGNGVRVERWKIVAIILYRLKSGCQWRMLPVEQFFTGRKLSWQGVYHHFRRWVSDGSFKRLWVGLLQQNPRLLNLSSMQLDGSHTLAKNGGEHIGYQSRRKARTTNALFLCDNEGLPLSLAMPQSGEHHDLYEIEVLFEQLCGVLQEAGIALKGVFMNADSGFDSEALQVRCYEKGIEANIDINERNQKQPGYFRYFDEVLYKRRFVMERMNAWMDSFKALLIRFETKVAHWMHLHFLAFAVLLIRKKANVKY